ncbi:hypothetical protein CANARDRAFT_200899 [[Candida] arabinofermentans NRRL YB-2248]|uniref:Major facilitator superfamily (MFS) profile domain-containing protein n=1 Tax=[Candida] arabinofermentans NRRL YB-2248 TaxID=983967 RepID=A0A1E4SYD7_9ASCO|nr:hypothetical protein CANARDRAFT_200899 [[Candida] arabinofermentans NRRL YB-2248]
MSSIPLIPPSTSQYTPHLIISVSLACLHSLQYGYHMSELNAPESYIKDELSLTPSQIGFITSIFSIGGLISSTLAGSISSKYGLRLSFIITSIFYIIGSMLEYLAYDLISMSIGRFISGLGAGLALVFVPLYINQISPLHLRGLLGSMNQVCVNLGILITQLLGIIWANSINWRLILLFASLIGSIGLILSLFFLDESPKWIIINEKNDTKGLKILLKLRLNEQDCLNEIKQWKLEHLEYLSMIQDTPIKLNLINYLKNPIYNNSKMVAMFTMIGQQFSGINSIIFYGVKILNESFPTNSIFINCLISFGNMIITFISSLYLDKLGRKPMLKLSISIMSLTSFGLSLGILFNNSKLTIISIFSYVCSFAIGVGPIPFLLISEVSQLEVKDLAQSFATDCNWISCFMVGLMFPILNGLIGGYVYLIFTLVCILFYFFISLKLPETKGKYTYNEVWGR